MIGKDIETNFGLKRFQDGKFFAVRGAGAEIIRCHHKKGSNVFFRHGDAVINGGYVLESETRNDISPDLVFIRFGIEDGFQAEQMSRTCHSDH